MNSTSTSILTDSLNQFSAVSNCLSFLFQLLIFSKLFGERFYKVIQYSLNNRKYMIEQKKIAQIEEKKREQEEYQKKMIDLLLPMIQQKNKIDISLSSTDGENEEIETSEKKVEEYKIAKKKNRVEQV